VYSDYNEHLSAAYIFITLARVYSVGNVQFLLQAGQVLGRWRYEFTQAGGFDALLHIYTRLRHPPPIY